MKFCHIFLPLLCALFVIAPATASPQAPEPRLHGSIREDTHTLLPGSMPSRLLAAQDLGPVAASHPLHGITLVFRRSDTQEADLQQLLAVQQNPASPEFHHWLTPEAFGARFGMAESDLAATTSWLSAQGFQVTAVSHARDRITFSGNAAQVQAAFGTTLHHYQLDGEVHLAPSSNLSLPADLAAITTAVLHLSDFRPHPLAHPAFTAASDQKHYLTPTDVEVMYDLPSGNDADHTSGFGQAIAIIGQSYVDTSGSARFRNFSTSTTTLSLSGVLVPNTGGEAISPEDAAETEIDLEYAGGIAPMADIFLVHVGSNPTYGAFDALAFSIDQNLAPVVSISYSECETFLSPTEVQQGNSLFQQAAAQGQTLIAASGDSGSTACALNSVSNFLSATQQQALAVSYPADSPYVTAVGGTQMAAGTFDSNNTTYWSPATIAGFDLVRSLLSYVPEVAWNEDSISRIFAGGGGASTAYARPSWQSGFPGIPQGATRLLPDIALQASGKNPGFILCTDDIYFLAAEGQRYGCQGGLLADNKQYTVGGGTSFAAPVFAAMTALINQSQHSLGQGNVNPTLYRLAANPTIGSSVFHDVTAGSTACVAGNPRCSAAGQSGFAAAPGYDQATGLGSVDYAHLLAAWPATAFASRNATTIALYPFYSSTPSGTLDPITIYVRADTHVPGDTPPTGTVSVSVDGAVVNPALSFDRTDPIALNGQTSYSLVAPATPGSHLVVVTYPGDSTHGPSTATTSILVGNVLASGGVTLSTGNVTLPANGSGSTTVTVTPSGGYNGRLFLSLELSGGTVSGPSVCYFIPTLAVQGVSSTKLSLGTGTACSSVLPAARSTLLPVAAHAAAGTPRPGSWSSVPVATAVLLCCLLPSTRRRRPLPLLCTFLIAAAAALSGCGGASNSSGGTGGAPTPPPQAISYTATLTAHDSVNGSITSSTSFTLTVQ